MERKITPLAWFFILTSVPLLILAWNIVTMAFPYELSIAKPEITVHVSSSRYFTDSQLRQLPEIRDPFHAGFQFGAQQVHIFCDEEATQTTLDIERRTAICADGTQNCNKLLEIAHTYGQDHIISVQIDSINNDSPDFQSTTIRHYYALVGTGENQHWEYLFLVRGN